MQLERAPQCILGNGDCPLIPVKCRLYEYSAEITAALGDDFDPQESRRSIIFADAFNKDVNVIQVAVVMSKCAKEGKPNVTTTGN